MSDLHILGIGLPSLSPRGETATQYVITQQALHRVLEFTGHSIHDVINNPIARNEVLGYYKLHQQVERACEVVDLERWWNGQSGL